VDQRVIEGLRNNDRTVIKELYKDSFGYCASFILNNRGDIDQARDHFQEALIVLFNNTLKPDFKLTCNVRTYLYSIIRNQWLKKISRQHRGGLKLVMDEDPNKEYVIVDDIANEDQVEVEEKHEAVSKAMKMIKGDCHDLLMSFYFKKIDLGSIAEKMGYTYQFVKVKKNRCMEALKKKVSEIYHDE